MSETNNKKEETNKEEEKNNKKEETNEEEETSEEEETNEESSDIMSSLTASSIIIFLGICLVFYYIISSFTSRGDNMNPEGSKIGLSRTLDILFLVILGVISYNVYYSYQENPDDGIFKNNFNKVKDYVLEPSSAFTTGMFIVIFYVFNKIVGIPTDKDTKPFFISIVEGAAWLLLIIILFIDFFKYVLKISIYDLFPFLGEEETPEEEIPEEPEDENAPKLEKCEKEQVDDPEAEVFNVSNNLYTYKDAKAICKAYDAELATYDQVENAYNNGAEWCGYGWSDNQMILFPTQKNTWDKLQKLDKKYRNNCGRPGVNGGYIANPYVKFGVNCFGKKPEATDADLQRMNARQNQTYPLSREEQELENKIKYWKENASEMLQLNSYNTNKWNKFGTSGKTTNGSQTTA